VNGPVTELMEVAATLTAVMADPFSCGLSVLGVVDDAERESGIAAHGS
jgi:hypothetical protein